jgi:hypothetical protein
MEINDGTSEAQKFESKLIKNCKKHSYFLKYFEGVVSKGKEPKRKKVAETHKAEKKTEEERENKKEDNEVIEINEEEMAAAKKEKED